MEARREWIVVAVVALAGVAAVAFALCSNQEPTPDATPPAGSTPETVRRQAH